MFMISTSYGMFEYTKRTSFCKGCHEMNQAHDTWMASKHGPILGEIDSCMACHAESGALGYIRAKMSGFKSVFSHVVTLIRGDSLEVERGTKPVYCTKKGCHTLSDLDTGLKIKVNHPVHAKKGFDCISCHDRIAHGWDDEIRSSPGMQDTCFNCHDNKSASHDDCGMCHIFQKAMLRGIGAKGVGDTPSPHGEGLSCQDCHTRSCAPDLKTCSSCHDTDMTDQVERRQAEVSIGIEELKASLTQLDRIFTQYGADAPGIYRDEHSLYEKAHANYHFMQKDLSRGVHNFEYVQEMLDASKEMVDRALSSFREKISYSGKGT